MPLLIIVTGHKVYIWGLWKIHMLKTDNALQFISNVALGVMWLINVIPRSGKRVFKVIYKIMSKINMHKKAAYWSNNW